MRPTTILLVEDNEVYRSSMELLLGLQPGLEVVGAVSSGSDAACAVAALVMATLSLGPRIVINGERTAIPGPYELLVGLPVVESALPMRFALAVIPLIATILALALDRASRLRWRPARILAPALTELLFELLAKRPEDRPESARLVAVRLDDCVLDLLRDEEPLLLAEYMGRVFGDARRATAAAVAEAMARGEDVGEGDEVGHLGLFSSRK